MPSSGLKSHLKIIVLNGKGVNTGKGTEVRHYMVKLLRYQMLHLRLVTRLPPHLHLTPSVHQECSLPGAAPYFRFGESNALHLHGRWTGLVFKPSFFTTSVRMSAHVCALS